MKNQHGCGHTGHTMSYGPDNSEVQTNTYGDCQKMPQHYPHCVCDIHLVDFINDTPLVEGNTITAEFRTSKQADSIECIIPAAGIRIDCKL